MKEWICHVDEYGDTVATKELVRCKDCKYYHNPEYGFTFGECRYGSAWFPAKEDGFCSDAKRKDN